MNDLTKSNGQMMKVESCFGGLAIYRFILLSLLSLLFVLLL